MLSIKNWMLLVAVLLHMTRSGNCELFTSLGHLTKLVESEAEITKYLRNFLNYEYEKLREAEMFVLKTVSTEKCIYRCI